MVKLIKDTITLIKDTITSMRSIMHFNALNDVIEQNIKNNRKCVIKYTAKTKMKYNKWKN